MNKEYSCEYVRIWGELYGKKLSVTSHNGYQMELDRKNGLVLTPPQSPRTSKSFVPSTFENCSETTISSVSSASSISSEETTDSESLEYHLLRIAQRYPVTIRTDAERKDHDERRSKIRRKLSGITKKKLRVPSSRGLFAINRPRINGKFAKMKKKNYKTIKEELGWKPK